MHILQLIRKNIYRVKRHVCRTLRLHPSSAPYISADTFREHADHVLDADCVIKPSLIKHNDIVFVSSGKTRQFFLEYHPAIVQPYILITHYDDENIDESFISHIDEKIIHWFTINCLVSHEKVTPLPLGLENLWYYDTGITSQFNTLRRKNVTKQNKILYKFSEHTNKRERRQALNQLTQHPLAETFSNWLTPFQYHRKLQHYNLTCSPPGSGEDCHRTWAALYLNVIPIVKRSHFTEYFFNMGLPMILVDSWEELAQYDEATLLKLTQLYKERFNHPALWSDYWIEKIKRYQK